jgi:hypothetical protein
MHRLAYVLSPACLIAVVLALPGTATAGDIDPAVLQVWDVVYTADGSVLKGVIVEEVPGVSVRVVIAGGTSIVVQMANVTRFTKELNPAVASGPMAMAPGGGAAVRPARVATGGLRVGITPGIAEHFEGDLATFYISGHAGWELPFEQWALIPGGTLDFLPDSGNYDADSFAIMGSVRAAYRGSQVSPFIGFGLGADVVGGDDTSLAVSMGLGIDLLVHKNVALTLEAKFHRGFADTYTETLYFGSIGMGVEVRL